MKTIQIANLDFDLHQGPVGCAVSGGADSAIMLYILMKNIEGPIHVYTCANRIKHRVNPVIALRVIGQLIDLTGRDDIYHHSFFVETQTKTSLFSPLSAMIKQHNLNIMYTAGTALPPDRDLFDRTKFSSDNGLYTARNQNEQRPVYNGPYYSPWWNKDKRFIAEVYRQLDMAETLYPITRSCESLTQTEGHCGQCWWCEERVWAFGKIN